MVRNFVLKLLLVFATAILAGAQTKLDLQHQARGIDFTGATYTKPVRIGSSLPGTCATAEAYILQSGPAGSNFYLCLAPNQWTLQGSSGGSGGGGSTGTPNILSSSVSGPNLTIGSSCSSTSPCNVRVGSTVYVFTSASTANLTGGTGTAYVFISSSGNLTVGHNLTLTCTSGCTAVPGILQFPAGAIPLAAWTATSGTWGAGTDYRSMLSIDTYTAGTGLQTAIGANSTQVNVDPAVVLERGTINGTGATLCTDSNGNATTAGCSSGGGSGLGDPGSNGVLKRTAVNTTGIAGATDIETALGFTPENVANKAVANGYAPLNASSQVPSANLATASTTTAGVVKVDGTSVTINGSGVISASGGGGGGNFFGAPTTTYSTPSGLSLLANGNSKGSITTNSDGSVTLTQADTGTTNQDWAYLGTAVTGSSAFTKSFYLKTTPNIWNNVAVGLCAWTGTLAAGTFSGGSNFIFMGQTTYQAVNGYQGSLTSTSATGGVSQTGYSYGAYEALIPPGTGVYLRFNHTPATSPYDYLSVSVDGITWNPIVVPSSSNWTAALSSALTSVGVCIANQSGQNYSGGSIVPGTRTVSVQVFGVQ